MLRTKDHLRGNVFLLGGFFSIEYMKVLSWRQRLLHPFLTVRLFNLP